MSHEPGDDSRVEFAEQAALQSISSLNARNQSRAQKAYDRSLMKESAVIMEVAQSGELSQMLRVEQDYQQRDFVYYAHSSKEKASVEQGLKDFARGLTHYELLTKRPDRYRENAIGYIDRDRDKKLDIPKDGMRKALNSQITRLQNRMALTSSPDEKDVLTARLALIMAIAKKYAEIQVEVVHHMV